MQALANGPPASSCSPFHSRRDPYYPVSLSPNIASCLLFWIGRGYSCDSSISWEPHIRGNQQCKSIIRRPGEEEVTMEDWHLWRGTVRKRFNWKYTSEKKILAWKWRTSECCWPSKESNDQFYCPLPLPGNSLWRPWPCGTPPGGHHGTAPGPVNSKLASFKEKLNDPTPQPPRLLLCLGWYSDGGDMTETEGNSVDAHQKRGFGESVELSRKNSSRPPAWLCQLPHAHCASTMQFLLVTSG